MISFSCSHCGLKLKVKPEFAGRSSKCPTCKKPLVVPQPDRTEGHVPKGEIDGTPSSIAQAGIEGGVTLGQKSVQELLARNKKGQRYIIQNEIARGGMGAVLLAFDSDIRREVAIKFMLDQLDPKKKLRFIEEAQITGQLEHPNIPPIHELAIDSQGRLFFSMKMVRGRSLKEVVDLLRDNPKEAEKEYTLGRLLNIFVNICNGMAYAHSRGVVHRDLKPANIMTGDFGEVYVMDWGLAKVLKLPEAQVMGQAAPMATLASGVSSSSPSAISVSSSQSKPSSKVSTSREPDADLTQEGAIVGTPVYMPPEQAMGEIGEIDQRSDVYSLGAILYEMLTLVPPIEKEGGHMSILLRVCEGDIKAPEVRVSQRARRIPRELSAVAMKALAKDKKDRYQTVEELRRDIERFQEGRSVSAKEDTKKEMIWKFVKRNKGFSAASFLGFMVACVILFFSFKINFQARLHAEEQRDEAKRNYIAYQKEQEERRAQGKKSVPAFVRAARLSINESQFDDAMAQVDVALGYDQEYADARLFKGALLIRAKAYAQAEKELAKYLELRQDDKDARSLLELCRKAKADDAASLLAFADVFQRQKLNSLADLMTHQAEQFIRSQKDLLPVYQKRIESAWPGLGSHLTIDKDGRFNLNGIGPDVADLTPIKAIPLTSLSLSGCAKVWDLTPLKGIPLTSLDLQGCAKVSDLTPLKGVKLTWLRLYSCPVSDLMPLKGMPLTWLSIHGSPVSDLSPLAGMPLTMLHLSYCDKVRDLTPLKGIPLSWLNLHASRQVSDLTPLKGMPLTTLDLSYTRIRDLLPLKDMPLKSLSSYANDVTDLTPLQGMSLEDITFTPKSITKGVDVLRQMKSLKTVHDGVKATPVAEFWKRYDAGEFNK